MYAPPMATPPAPPTQYPGMYTPPNATPPAPPPQPATYTEYTDQGPPKYSDLYKSHPPPPPMAPQQATYTPPAAPLPEKPSSTSEYSIKLKIIYHIAGNFGEVFN